jgi:hypothetical protein
MLKDARIFRNYTTGKFEAECTEMRPMRQMPSCNAWFIKMGFAGFNSVANNWNGYRDKGAAERACLRYQYKGEKP